MRLVEIALDCDSQDLRLMGVPKKSEGFFRGTLLPLTRALAVSEGASKRSPTKSFRKKDFAPGRIIICAKRFLLFEALSSEVKADR